MPSVTQGLLITDSGEIAPGVIVDSDVNAAAAIAMSKLNLAITNNEVAAGAAIAQNKLNLAITNAEIDAAAAIVDTKLAEISTANKVNGTALKNLAGIPAGAGTIPNANLPSIAEMVRWIDEAAFGIVSSAVRVMTGFNNETEVLRLAANATNTVSFKCRVPSGATTISSIEIIYLMGGAGGGNFIFDSTRITREKIDGTARVSDNDAATETVAAGATADRTYKYTLPVARFSSIAAVAAGDIVTVFLQRLGADGADTATGTFDIFGAVITFA